MSFARWPYFVFGLLDATWFLCGIFCIALAAAFVLRKNTGAQADELIARLEEAHGSRLLAAGLYFPALLAIGNLARFRIYYLTSDSANFANTAWNFAHGYGLTSVLIGGRSAFALHFAFVSALLAPLLLIWNSAGVLAVAHGLALGSVPLMLFALAKRKSDSRLVPWLIFLMALAHPSFQELSGTILDDSLYALPCFIAAAYFFETGRAALGFFFGILMFAAREQVPFISFGVGLYLFFRRRPARRAGAALMAASAAIWLAEMRLIARERAGWLCYGTWALFKDLGNSPRALLAHALARPWDFGAALFFPWTKLLPVLRVLSHAAFLPLFAGASFLPALFVWIPHQLAQSGSSYQGLRAHYASFVLGPLLWATLGGLIEVHKRCAKKHRRSLVAVLFIVAGWGFLTAPRFYSPDIRVIPKAWESAAPKALAQIPPGAPVWCDSYLTPHLAMRHDLKALPLGFHDCGFENDLFMPDYVLMSAYWARKDYAPASGTILRFLRKKGFVPIFRDADLTILANPGRDSARGAEPEKIKLPDEDGPISGGL